MMNEETNMLEISLKDKEIDDLIIGLAHLKETRKPVHIDIDTNHQLVIHKEEKEDK